MHTMKDIQEIGMHDPIVHACLRAGEHHGWSTEQTLIEMAWHLRKSNQSLQTQLTNVLMNSPRIYALNQVIGQPSPFKVAKKMCEACDGSGRLKEANDLACDDCHGTGVGA